MGPSTYGGDADSLNSPLPGWTGPACQITYGLNGEQFGWRIEVRTDFEDAIEAAKKREVKNSGEYALTELSKKLKQDDFPILLTAEWEQADRLINLMQRPEIDQSLKLRIIPLLGSTSDPSVLPTLKQALNNPVLAPQAAIALENARLFTELAQYRDHLEELVSERTAALEAAQAQVVRQEKLAAIGQVSGSTPVPTPGCSS